MASFHFDLVSPEKLLFSGDVDQVDVPGWEGDFGVLAGHAPFVTTVRPGIVTIFREGGALKVVVNGGFAEVNPQGLTVLADMAVPLDDFDRSVLASQRQARSQARAVEGAAGGARSLDFDPIGLNWIKD
jgi:F-type H+-transporting ATPase subunit epsilon